MARLRCAGREDSDFLRLVGRRLNAHDQRAKQNPDINPEAPVIDVPNVSPGDFHWHFPAHTCRGILTIRKVRPVNPSCSKLNNWDSSSMCPDSH
jgi:hypothetical protein